MNKKQSKKYKHNKELILRVVYISSLFLITLIIGKLTFASKDHVEANQIKKCDRKKQLNFEDQKEQSLQGNTNNNQSLCYQFYLQSEQLLIIDSNTEVRLQYPDSNISVLQGKKELNKQGGYLLIIDNNQKYKVELDIKETTNLLTKNTDTSQLAKTKTEQVTASFQGNNLSTQLIYNQTTPPPFKSDGKRQNIVDNIVDDIVDDIVDIAEKRGLKKEKLSISLVDLNSTESKGYDYASFAGNQPRYPASIVKLFWMVVLFGQYEKGILPPREIPGTIVSDLIKDSDNEAGSIVLDKITKSESGSSLPLETIKAWKAKRDTVNFFFEKAAYTNINISQKTYPIPYLKMNLPAGRDKQLRDKNLKLQAQEVNPIRNYLTTDSVARLLFEIYANQSVSDSYSNEMKKLLKRDLNPAAWRNKPYNAIKGFLGEGLPPDTNFYSKMGWTFNNRNDAAIIESSDGKVRYILVIFGDDKSFYEDKKFLPEASKQVYKKMTDIYKAKAP